jgi:hypothetical protein
VGRASDRYLRDLRRRNYVTPTSYLALIATFKSLLKGKRDEILSLKTRYEMGLGKLEFASSQVQKDVSIIMYYCLGSFTLESRLSVLYSSSVGALSSRV